MMNSQRVREKIMSRYTYELNLDSDSVAARIVRLVGFDKRVLELGCSTGHMSQVLNDRGCKVTGIELSAADAEQAKKYCENVVKMMKWGVGGVSGSSG